MTLALDAASTSYIPYIDTTLSTDSKPPGFADVAAVYVAVNAGLI